MDRTGGALDRTGGEADMTDGAFQRTGGALDRLRCFAEDSASARLRGLEDRSRK